MSERTRMRVSQEEKLLILGIREQAEAIGLSIEDIPDGWLKSKTSSIRFKNPNFRPKVEKELEELEQAVIQRMQEHVPVYPEIIRKPSKDGHLLVIDPADIHLGKLASAMETGEEYNNQIAVQRVKEGVQGILNKASGFNIDQIVLVAGNDVLHIDSPKRTTTSGTPQDTDGMWYDNFELALQLYVDVIEMLLPVADVHFMFNPSNHDYTHGFFLAQNIKSWFRQSKNITFDCSISHRKYYLYHDNLIGTSHGDGAKMQDLPMLMATEVKHWWSESAHRYVYVHHLHHKWSKDVFAVCVEGLRSPSGTDSWHHRNGYQHAPKAIEGFIHHPQHGQIARLTHIF